MFKYLRVKQEPIQVAPDPGALSIIDIVLSKEPLGPLTPQSDPQFSDIVRWTKAQLSRAAA